MSAVDQWLEAGGKRLEAVGMRLASGWMRLEAAVGAPVNRTKKNPTTRESAVGVRLTAEAVGPTAMDCYYFVLLLFSERTERP